MGKENTKMSKTQSKLLQCSRQKKCEGRAVGQGDNLKDICAQYYTSPVETGNLPRKQRKLHTRGREWESPGKKKLPQLLRGNEL